MIDLIFDRLYENIFSDFVSFFIANIINCAFLCTFVTPTNHYMKSVYLFISISLLCLVSACTGASAPSQEIENDSLSCAQGLCIAHLDNYTAIDIKNPWKDGTTLQRYILVPRDAEMPNNLPEGSVVRTPIKRALVYSGVHANVFKELGHIESVKGVCDAQYFTLQEIIEGVENGSVMNAGSSMAPSKEIIIALNPDAIILSPYQNSDYSELEKLGIPIIQCADYMESTPLGRAEWIKLFGELLDETEKADSIYNNVMSNYAELKQSAAAETKKPKILSENIINGTWYVPGGNSYMAQLFADAGGAYAWSDIKTTGSIPLDMPQVLEKAHDADIWLIKSFDPTLSYAKLKADNALNAEFKAFKEQHIYFCNTAATTFFQDFPFHPEVLLKEYIAIFHPQLLPDYTTGYFQPLINE